MPKTDAAQASLASARSAVRSALTSMVDTAQGTLSAAIFCDPQIYELEKELLFGRTWLFVAHESLIPNAGDFFQSRMGEDPVLVVRQKSGGIEVYLNQCRHRGARLCRADLGSTRNWTCAYHGWTYDLAGKLVSISKEEAVGGDKIDKSKWGLVKVAKTHSYHGLIFATWNPNAPSFDEFLGDAKWYFDLIFDRPNGTEVIGGVQKWVVQANWKLGAEQFTSDIYHFDYTHLGTTVAMLPDGVQYQESPPVRGRQFRGNGHGGVITDDVALADMQTAFAMGLDILSYNQSRRPEMEERLGPVRAHRTQSIHANLFPNLGILPLNQTIRVWQPRGPDAMEVWAWTIVDKDAPEHIKAEARRRTQFTFASSGIYEQDDAENWAEVQRTLRGWVGRRSILNNQIGKGETQDPEGVYPGTTDFAIGEAASREFYAKWRDMLMAAD